MKTILSMSDKWNDQKFLNLELKFCSCPQINRPLNAVRDYNIEGNISEALLFNSSYWSVIWYDMITYDAVSVLSWIYEHI